MRQHISAILMISFVLVGCSRKDEADTAITSRKAELTAGEGDSGNSVTSTLLDADTPAVDLTSPVAAIETLHRLVNSEGPDAEQIRKVFSDRLNEAMLDNAEVRGYAALIRFELAINSAAYEPPEDLSGIVEMVSGLPPYFVPADVKDGKQTAEAFVQELIKGVDTSRPKYDVIYDEGRKVANVHTYAAGGRRTSIEFSLKNGQWRFDTK